MESTKGYLEQLSNVVDKDVIALKKAEKNYGDSWKKRGGVGAYMMLARKWDRLENYLKGMGSKYLGNELNGKSISDYDIFAAIMLDKRPEGIIDDIRDLRRYLILIEAEMIAQGALIDEVKKCETTNSLAKAQDFLANESLNLGVPTATQVRYLDKQDKVRIKEYEKEHGMERPFGFNPEED